MGERGTLCGLCPKNNTAAYKRGHRATYLSKLAWPLVQVSLILYIVSFSSSNWCDGLTEVTGVNGRIYAGAWKACLATEVNTTLHPNELPVAICSDTASYIVDGLKTGWVGAWRTFLILSFLLLLLTSTLLSIYVFGGRALNHSTFPLFFAFTSGFASSMFGVLSLLVFHVQAGKAPELKGVPYGWAAGVNIAAVVTISYTVFLILGEHMEITEFRASRKAWRRKQHATVSNDTTFPPPVGSGSWECATHTVDGNGNDASASVTTPQVTPAPGHQQQMSSVVHMAEQWQVPSAVAMFQTSSTSSENTSGTISVKAQAAATASATATVLAEPTALPAPSTLPTLIPSAPLAAHSILSNDDRPTSTTLQPPMTRKAGVNLSGKNQNETESLAGEEEEEVRFRFRNVTLRRNRRSSQVDPGNLPS